MQAVVVTTLLIISRWMGVCDVWVWLRGESVSIKGKNWVVGFVIQSSKDESIMATSRCRGLSIKMGWAITESCGPFPRLAANLEFVSALCLFQPCQVIYPTDYSRLCLSVFLV